MPIATSAANAPNQVMYSAGHADHACAAQTDSDRVFCDQ